MGDRAQTGDDLYRKLVWITFFRVVVVTVLLGATAVLDISERNTFTGRVQIFIYSTTAVVYLATLLYVTLLRFGPGSWRPTLAYAQVFGDVLLAAYLLWLTGGGESLFAFLFSLAIVNGAIVRFRAGAFAAALLSTLAYMAVTLGLQSKLVPPPTDYLAPALLPTARLTFNLFVNGTAFFLIAALASYLSEQVRWAGEQLSEAKEDYAALAMLHERIVHSVTSGIMTVDVAGELTFLNAAGEALLGRRQQELRRRPLAATMPELWDAVGHVGHALGVPGRGETRLPGPSGSLHVGFTVSPLSGPGSGALVIVFQDLTTIRRMEEVVRRSERLAAIGALAAGLAHEIRNPLASMSGSIELLRAGLPAGADDLRLMEIVLRETERLDRLMTDFLQFAKPTPPSFGTLDVAALAEETADVFRNDPRFQKCRLEFRADGPIEIVGDSGQLRQVLLNLLINAAQATGGEGDVTLEIASTAEGVVLSLTDDGSGMEPSVVERIFDPFFTTKDKGTGLGLALVHRAVEAHGGDVHVVSTPGKGSTFTITLPVAAHCLSTEASKSHAA